MERWNNNNNNNNNNNEMEEVAPRSAPLPFPYPSQPPFPPAFLSSSPPSNKSENRIGKSNERTMKNPEQLKYLMRAGHKQRTSPSQPVATAQVPASHAAVPALNSTAQLQRKAQAIANEVFEEDAEVRAEVEKRAKEVKPPKSLLDFAPNEQRYVNLIPIDAPTPEPAHARRPAKSSAPPRHTQAHAHATPSITGPCFERNTASPRFGVVTRSVYVQPVTTPACDATPHASLRTYLHEHAEL